MNLDILRMASEYAQITSGCTKVKVGSVITRHGDVISIGSNRTIPNDCKTLGCNRVRLYGDNSKEHRLPSDCNAIHSEIDAIAKSRESLIEATIYITRYPCEACARAIVAAGITKVIYGREQEISEITKRIFSDNNVKVVHESSFKEEDTTA